jgi:hypothetical protein
MRFNSNKYNNKMEQVKSPKSVAYARNFAFTQALANLNQERFHLANSKKRSSVIQPAIFTNKSWNKFPLERTPTSEVLSIKMKDKQSNQKIMSNFILAENLMHRS